MTDLTQLLFASTLAALLSFLVLVLPLLLMFAGHLRPWFLEMAAERAASAEPITIKSAPLARRHAPRASASSSKKVAVSKAAPSSSSSSKATPKKKAAPKKKATAKKKVAKTKSAAKSAPAKKAAASKEATAKPKAKKVAKKAATKKAAAVKKKAPAGAKVDPTLGVIYTKKPAEPDDLKKISGVAKVLEGKLHAEGIYTYQQIADWTPAQMEAFGERLSFKNRIQRDDWKSQAKALDKAKKG